MIRPLLLARILVFAAAQAVAAPARNTLPSVSPDGSKIAFLSNRDSTDEVYVIGVDGKGERRMTRGGAQAVQWVRSGSELLVTGTRADSGRVLRGVDKEVVASVEGRNPRLSPDGKRVLYLSGPWTSTALMVAHADGSKARQVAGGRTTAWNGAWSPDGMKIAYTYGDSTRVLQIHVVSADGSGDHALTHNTVEEGSAQMPSWSADGRFLAYQVSQSRTKTSHIWILELRTGQSTKIAPHGEGVLDEVPSWFPDGKRLAFQSNRSAAMEIWTMRADGSDRMQLTGLSP